MNNFFSVSKIRQSFLDFFVAKGHTIVPSSSLVPHNDPTLMFTNSGMVQFKDVFLGTDKRNYKRAVSVQTCLRAGGKHNDLENVGYTARHHTFFEMLGNWSFGDYFKKEALLWSWELLTEIYKLPAEKLLATVYHEDTESYEIWTKLIGLPKERVIKIGDKDKKYKSDNFWMMADTGPCGPCSEIFYDHGPKVAGGPPGSLDEDGDRFIEIWNNVFMQFNMDEAGNLTELPAPCVDTGMGLERIAAILQNVHSNYEIDVFQDLIKKSAEIINCQDLENPSLKVIADHIRAASFLVVDEVFPNNEGRGYVQRRIIRRAIRHGYKLGQKLPFFYKLVPELVRLFGDSYPKISEQQEKISQILKSEEERFFETLANGMEILETEIAKNPKILSGEIAFKLHDTFGFPLDLTSDVCREKNIKVDEKGFEKAMNRQKENARKSGKFKMDKILNYEGRTTKFIGYESLTSESQVLTLYLDGENVNEINCGQKAGLVLDISPFYAESGGQIGDAGIIFNEKNKTKFIVQDTQKLKADVVVHHGFLESGNLKLNDKIQAQVQSDLRNSIKRNHSATHLMHKALRQVLGSHVQQKGSLVDSEKTRFDFTHNSQVSKEEIKQIEKIVNQEILLNLETKTQITDIETAKKSGAMMLFNEKYGDLVRVLNIGSSCELCGGTHVKSTGEIGVFKIISESSVASGIRRIEAITGEKALKYFQDLENNLNQISSVLKVTNLEIINKIKQNLESNKNLEKKVLKLKNQLADNQINELIYKAEDCQGIKVLFEIIDSFDMKTLRNLVDKLKDKLGKSIILLVSQNPENNEKLQIIAGVSKAETNKIHAGELVNFVAKQLKGKGGGNPSFAVGSGENPKKINKLNQILNDAKNWIFS